jgi:hypothetical protein
MVTLGCCADEQAQILDDGLKLPAAIQRWVR